MSSQNSSGNDETQNDDLVEVSRHQNHGGQQYSRAGEDEIDFQQLFVSLWAGKWLICGITFAAAVVGLIVALWMPNIYRSEALLAPSQRDQAGGLASLAAQYGGLASLAGISLPREAMDNTQLGLEIIRSRGFIMRFIERHDLLVPLMAADGWDEQTNTLEIDPDIYDTRESKWVRDVRPPKKTIPSIQEAYEEFAERLSVNQNKKTGFVTVAVEYFSPFVAKEWVDLMVKDLNTTVMSKDVDKAQQAITYLREQLESTSMTELRNVFFRLIEEHTKTMILSKVSPEYVFNTVDPAIIPEKKIAPRRTVIVLVSAFLGFALALVLVLFLPVARTFSSVGRQQ